MYWHGVKVADFGAKYPFTLFVYFYIQKLLTLQALQCIGTEVQHLSFAACLALPGCVKKSRVWKNGGILAKIAFCFFWLGFLVGFFFFCFSSSLQPNSQPHWQSELYFTGHPVSKKKVAFPLAEEKDGSHVHGIAASFSDQSQLVKWSTLSAVTCKYFFHFPWH